jgi:hypothetical protein
MDWGERDSSSREPAYQAQGPDFKPQNHQKKKKKNKKREEKEERERKGEEEEEH